MYVASSEYNFSPYEKIMVRIGNTDNLFESHSSFVCEIREAEKCVTHSNNKSLIFPDLIKSTTSMSLSPLSLKLGILSVTMACSLSIVPNNFRIPGDCFDIVF